MPALATLALWFRVVSYLNSTRGRRKGLLTFPRCRAPLSSPWYEGPLSAALGTDGLLVSHHPCRGASGQGTWLQEAQKGPSPHDTDRDQWGDLPRTESLGLSPPGPRKGGHLSGSDHQARTLNFGSRRPISPKTCEPGRQRGAFGGPGGHASDNVEWVLPSSPLPLPVLI